MPAESLDLQWGLCPGCVRTRGERASLDDDPGATRGKAGRLDDVPAIPEPKRCKGLVELNHAWTCEAVLGPDDGDQCAHCANLESQIRAEDAAVEEGERASTVGEILSEETASQHREAQAKSYGELLKLHRGDARAVMVGVLRTLVAAKVVTEEEETAVHDAVVGVVGGAFDRAEKLSGLPLVMFWTLLVDVAQAERMSLLKGGEDACRGCA